MKHDDRVDAYGEVDETNAWVGLARASRLDADLDAHLVQIQRDLFALGAQLADPADKIADRVTKATLADTDVARRSEEHTSELQSLRHLVCRLLLEKKKL